ncbi:ATP-dependent zinc metalloprotease FtsH [Schleiferiaceae bacterium]|nr:ATP-dependent zinc metalloprotease FtsH [Schleiferiaceae bacterium]MDA9192380.1 ATP-dependent zinc metalloprotease FtsH [Schleiferiaceae bacterium]MDB2572848.1 ATP-dependent zinc metalloprotease FtsH [Schleiferiaceae bacterium]MDC0082689.1 ATP-dependent zinc metalloprotease FtsH [Schleiferiaceae bacterium]
MADNPNQNQIDKLKKQFAKNKGTKGDDKKPGTPKKGGNKFNFYWIYIIVFALFIGMQIFTAMSFSTKNSTYQEFEQALELEDVDHVNILNDRKVQVFIKEESLRESERYDEVSKTNFSDAVNPGPHYVFEMPSTTFEDRLKDYYEARDINDRIPVNYQTQDNFLGDIVSWVLPLVLMVAVWMFLMRRMSGGGAGGAGGGSQIFNIGKSRAKVYDKDTEVKTTFAEVAGMTGAKEEVLEVVDFLKNPKKYTDLGGRIPKGVMLSGPPGTGKTLLAKAVAGEAKVPFFSLSGSDFVEMFVGVGASRVRDLFKQAKEKSPCIIFIDEIDAIGRARGKNNFSGGNDERENTLNQLLTEMDGFGTNEHVIVMAATNRADILDRALMRAGRFDRIIYVDLPELTEREAIFEVHLKGIKTDDSVDVGLLSKQTPGFSGADIANVCNEAALIAARKEKKEVGKQDFLDAVDRIVGGLEKKTKIITESEKKVIAYHEAGHAATSWLLEHAAPLVKVTIVPRGRSLGAAWYLPEERQITTADQMLDEMCATMGGRAAEKVIFDKISTGALSDLEKVTKQARAMVTVYGLNDVLGNVTYYDSQGQNEYAMDKPYSEHTAETIDQEISKIIEKQYERAIEMLENNREKLDQLANLLLEKEVIFKENVEEIFGKRPWDKEEEKVEEVAASTETGTAVNAEEPASIEATVEESIEDTNKVTPSVETDTSSDIAASKEE